MDRIERLPIAKAHQSLPRQRNCQLNLRKVHSGTAFSVRDEARKAGELLVSLRHNTSLVVQPMSRLLFQVMPWHL